MPARRVMLLAGALIVAVGAGYLVNLTKPFAQGGPPGGAGGGGMPGGMGGGGMPGGMGGGGMPGGMGMGGPGMGGGGGAAFTWSEAPMPDELRMTYGEFLAVEGQAAVPLPEFYLYESNGTPKRYTRNQWLQLARVYEDRPVDLERPLVGNPGGKLWQGVYLEAAVKHNEVNAIWKCWCDALSNFWFEIGYPRIGPQMLQYDWQRKSFVKPDGTIGWERWEATLPDPFTITIPVVMHVKDRCQKTYAARFYNAMKPFDNRGEGRSPFQFMTYEGGYLKPVTFYLTDETIQVWNDLWRRVQLQLRLFDPQKREIVRAQQSAGLTPSIFTQMINPPTIYYQPRYRLVLPPEDNRFKGGRLNLDGKQGWYFEFDFTLTKAQLKALDGAQARLTVDGGPPERMRFLGAPSLAGGAAAGGGGGEMGGAFGGGAGGPGMPGGGMPGGGMMGAGAGMGMGGPGGGMGGPGGGMGGRRGPGSMGASAGSG